MRIIAPMQNLLWFVLAAALEIAGCYCAWMWLRLGRSIWWLAPGALSLSLFAVVLTRVDAAVAGRAYGAYGGVYIVSSLVWLSAVEGTPPRPTDVIGAAISLAGAIVILYGPRWTAG
jgi:small multidrug resistance family-3 protein